MDAVVHGRLTTAVAVLVVGNVAGHVLRPFLPGMGAGRAALFALLMLATGAWRGRRARALADELRGAPTATAAAARHAALYAAGTLAVAMLGYMVIHGLPFR